MIMMLNILVNTLADADTIAYVRGCGSMEALLPFAWPMKFSAEFLLHIFKYIVMHLAIQPKTCFTST